MTTERTLTGLGAETVRGRPLRVLAVASYPVEAAATRYRIAQFVEPLARAGITVDIRPLISSRLFRRLYSPGGTLAKTAGLAAAIARRLTDLLAASRADVLFVQREAALVGPPIFESLARGTLGRPLVLDLDDATFTAYVSPTYGRAASWLKWFSKTDELITRSAHVLCGNEYIASYVRARGASATVVPTMVDLSVFCPQTKPVAGGPLTVGWIGSHSTLQYLEPLAPVFERLARRHQVRVLVVGGGRPFVVPGVEVVNREWDLAREVDDFRSLDVGVYPIREDEWSVGKSGFKAVQYMALGVPFVASPVGSVASMVSHGETGFLATGLNEWEEHLDRLLADADLRARIGMAGRREAELRFDPKAFVPTIASVLRAAAAGRAAIQ